MTLFSREPNPAPFSFIPTEQWEGSDGSWNTFGIQVGTPGQTFRVFASTASQETWIPIAGACGPTDPVNCTQLRGIQNGSTTGFNTNASSSWLLANIYSLGLEDNLNYTGNGEYGFDSIGPGLQDNSLSIGHQIVAGIVTNRFMLGIFGLRPKDMNFMDSNNPQPSFMSSLRNQSLIPSLSYGYSAGASYRNQSPASLTLGGYDAAAFKPNNLNFTLNSNATREMVIGIQEIQADNTLVGTVSLLPQGILSFIDSTIPEIWLPLEACLIFENSFGLIFDNYTERYLLNDTVHLKLKELNPTITFKLGANATGGPTIDLTFPYAAFDLEAGWPIYQNQTNYFPLRRALNESQFAIGRIFLQETYLIADYERGDFSISQSVFTADPKPNVISILPVEELDTPNRGISQGVIIGSAVGTFALLTFLCVGIFVYWRFKKKQKKLEASTKADLKQSEAENPYLVEISAGEEGPKELFALNEFTYTRSAEMDAGLVPEMGGKEIMAELP
ncbi:hypothetical protein G7Y89_g13401 [Cudoniella acicularis]|uniref:Peptidase A1 domain-containing protein n=1 Tax=Cudoniella acicularis TaxID=354080 RepID=A0A8H4R9Z4_9HELO|nr:hypothetical protein G7Y89_g13401 [Cudoniella acicularis]